LCYRLEASAIFSVALVPAIFVLAIAGCGDHPADSANSESTGQLLLGIGDSTANSLLVQSGEALGNRVVIDAGIVFADESSYLCFPLSSLGIYQADSIEGMHSSCECIRPRLVRYLDHSREIVDAMRLDFVADGAMTSNDDRQSYWPSLLSVELRLELASGNERTIRVNFLETVRASELLLPDEGRDEY
jgi:hypothetical protein